MHSRRIPFQTNRFAVQIPEIQQQESFIPLKTAVFTELDSQKKTNSLRILTPFDTLRAG